VGRIEIPVLPARVGLDTPLTRLLDQQSVRAFDQQRVRSSDQQR